MNLGTGPNLITNSDLKPRYEKEAERILMLNPASQESRGRFAADLLSLEYALEGRGINLGSELGSKIYRKLFQLDMLALLENLPTLTKDVQEDAAILKNLTDQLQTGRAIPSELEKMRSIGASLNQKYSNQFVEAVWVAELRRKYEPNDLHAKQPAALEAQVKFMPAIPLKKPVFIKSSYDKSYRNLAESLRDKFPDGVERELVKIFAEGAPVVSEWGLNELGQAMDEILAIGLSRKSEDQPEEELLSAVENIWKFIQDKEWGRSETHQVRFKGLT